MALSRPLMEEQQLMGVACELDNNRPGGVNYIIERPAQDGLPEVIRNVDDDDGNLPILISPDEDEVGEVEIAVDEGEVELSAFLEDVAQLLLLADSEGDKEEEEEGQVEVDVLDEGEFISRFPFEDSDSDSDDDEYEDEDEDEDEDEGEDEDEDDEDEDAWSNWESSDSGYSSMCEEDEEDEEEEEEEEEEEVEEEEEEEDEEDSEDDDDDDGNIRPRSPLAQRLPPQSAWQGFRQRLDFSLSPLPFGILPAQQVERPEEGRPSVCPRSQESASSTSGLSCSTKRSWEEGCTEKGDVKRQRQCEDTSGLGTSTTWSREEDYRYGFRRYWQRSPDDSDSDSD